MTTVHWITGLVWFGALVCVGTIAIITRAPWARTLTLFLLMPPVGVVWVLSQKKDSLWSHTPKNPPPPPEYTGDGMDEAPTPRSALPEDPMEIYYEEIRPDDTDISVLDAARHELEGADDLIRTLERGRDRHQGADPKNQDAQDPPER